MDQLEHPLPATARKVEWINAPCLRLSTRMGWFIKPQSNQGGERKHILAWQKISRKDLGATRGPYRRREKRGRQLCQLIFGKK